MIEAERSHELSWNQWSNVRAKSGLAMYKHQYVWSLIYKHFLILVDVEVSRGGE
jgi:hypothetical protein